MTRGQSEGKKNFYAVSKVQRTGIFKGVGWSEVKPLVDKFAGNVYKGFVTLAEAMEFMKKGGFSESEIHIYDKVPDDFTTNAELENIASEERNQVPESSETLDASETEVKFYDAVTPNDGDSASKQGAAATISRDETEHVQKNATDLSNPRKTQCAVCNGGESKEMLQCSECNGRVHLACSGLPIYQIKVFRNTQRKFMCEPCVQNSSEIQTKDARKSYSELAPDERPLGIPAVQQETNTHQPAASSVSIPPSQAEDIAEIKREVGNVKLTLSNFEYEMIKIVLEMRDEILMLKDKLCEEKLRYANEEKSLALKQVEKTENKMKELETQNQNLKDKIVKVQSECENLRTCISRHSEVQSNLKQEIQNRDAEIKQLREKSQGKSSQDREPVANIANNDERDNDRNTSYVCDVQTKNRYEPLANNGTSSNAAEQDKVSFVEGHRDPLSNCYTTKFTWNRTTFHSLEQAFQHEKAMRHRDPDTAKEIMRSKHAGIAQKLGRNVRLHPGWDKDKDGVMQRMLQQKYRQCDAFRRALHQTESNRIVQRTADRYWGTGHDGRGFNKMGKLLEELRQRETTDDRHSDRPRKPAVAIFGSSLIKNMDAEQLSHSFRTDLQMSYTIPEAKQNICEYKRKADVVVYQLLSNDIKEKSVDVCIEEMKELIEITKNMQDNVDIIVSLPTNRGDNKSWNNKVNSVNASMKMEFQDSKRVHISDNSNLSWRGAANQTGR